MKGVFGFTVMLFFSYISFSQSTINDAPTTIKISTEEDTYQVSPREIHICNFLLFDTNQIILTPSPYYLPINSIDTANYNLADFEIKTRNDTTTYHNERGTVTFISNKNNELIFIEVSLYPMKTYSYTLTYNSNKITRIQVNKTWYSYKYEGNKIVQVNKIKLKRDGAVKILESYSIEY